MPITKDLKNKFYYHYTSIKFSKIKDAEQGEDDFFKPRGFWISDDDDYGWKKWCEENGSFSNQFKYKYQIELNHDANILYITSPQQLDEFSEKYKTDKYDYLKHEIIYITWSKITSKYDGIIITPYFWERRMGSRSTWYYSWDCASGCIWNANAIKQFKMI